MEEDISKIDAKLSKAFKAIKEDMNSLRDDISSLKNKKEEKPEKQDNSELKRLSKNILDLTDYFSQLKDEIKELKKAKPETPKESNVKDIIEFNEVKSELADLKYLIENIKIPAQKDYSPEIEDLRENIENLEDNFSKLRKEIKSIRIPEQYDYSQDINSIAKELGEIKGSQVNRKYLDKEIGRINEDISGKILELERKQELLETAVEDRARQPIVFSLREEIKQLKFQIEADKEKSENLLEETRKENQKLRKEIEEQNSELKQEIILLKGKLTRLSQKQPIEEAKEEYEKIKFTKLNRTFIAIFISLLIVVLIVASIIILVQPSLKAKYSLLDVSPSNSIGLPMAIYYNQNKFFSISGWESQLNFSGKEDRIAGNNLTGWFFNSTINIDERKVSSNKYINAKLIPNNNSINYMLYNYTLFKDKPYFKVQFIADTQNNSRLGDMAYGWVTSGFDIYLANGTIVKNDNSLTYVNGTSVMGGSAFSINDSNYEIFYNPDKNASIIAYSPNTEQFENSFYWNVFWVYVNGDNGIYHPLYFIILEDAKLSFENGKWQVQSKYYSGEIEKYIYSSVSDMNK